MAAHRYWRAVGIETYGGLSLSLSCFQLFYEGTRVDALASLSSNVAPSAGTLSALQDDDLTTAATWSYAPPGRIVLTWDFGGSTRSVDDIKLAGFVEGEFVFSVNTQWSDDAVTWTPESSFVAVSWPGTKTKTQSTARVVSGAVLALNLDGVNGSTTFTDASAAARSMTAVGGAAISTTKSVFGGSSLYLNGSGQFLKTSSTSADFNFGSGDFTLEAFFWPTDFAAARCIVGTRLDTNSDGTAAIFLDTSGKLNFYVDFFNGIGAWDITIAGATAVSTTDFSFVQAKREGNLFQLFCNGVLVGSQTGSGSLNNTSSGFTVGASSSLGQIPFKGYIDSVLVVKGKAQPNAVPTSPLGKVSIARNEVLGRVSANETYTAILGPAMVYGNAAFQWPLSLRVEDGSVKDVFTGVLGVGIGRVRGAVAEKATPNTPLQRKVRLIREKDSLLIRECWSDPVTGAYDFRFVDEAQSFTVVTYDHLNNYRAVIADNLTLANGGVELMP